MDLTTMTMVHVFVPFDPLSWFVYLYARNPSAIPALLVSYNRRFHHDARPDDLASPGLT